MRKRGEEGRRGEGRRKDIKEEERKGGMEEGRGGGKGKGEGNPLIIHLKQSMVHPHHHHHPKEISQVPLFSGSIPLLYCPFFAVKYFIIKKYNICNMKTLLQIPIHQKSSLRNRILLMLFSKKYGGPARDYIFQSLYRQL